MHQLSTKVGSVMMNLRRKLTAVREMRDVEEILGGNPGVDAVEQVRAQEGDGMPDSFSSAQLCVSLCVAHAM